MTLVLGVALVVGARGGGPPTVEQRLRSITSEIRCPTCRSQSVLESDSTQAQSMRTDIVRRLQAGQSEGEIKAYYASRFGDQILLTPESSGVAGLVWVLPVAAFVVAVAGLAVAFRRWRVGGDVEVSDADRVLVERARRGLR